VLGALQKHNETLVKSDMLLETSHLLKTPNLTALIAGCAWGEKQISK